jgi:hypothetical protein
VHHSTEAWKEAAEDVGMYRSSGGHSNTEVEAGQSWTEDGPEGGTRGGGQHVDSFICCVFFLVIFSILSFHRLCYM